MTGLSRVGARLLSDNLIVRSMVTLIFTRRELARGQHDNVAVVARGDEQRRADRLAAQRLVRRRPLEHGDAARLPFERFLACR